jgi:hypothetical protein
MTTQLYYKDGDGNYIPVHKYNIRTVWRPIKDIPRTGEEVLVVYSQQGNVKQLVNFNKIHGYWESKGIPCLGLEENASYWYRITDPVR